MLELTQVQDFTVTVTVLLGGEMPESSKIEGTKIRAGVLTEMLARLTECGKQYRFLSHPREVSRREPENPVVYSCLQQVELTEAVTRFTEWWLGRK